MQCNLCFGCSKYLIYSVDISYLHNIYKSIVQTRRTTTVMLISMKLHGVALNISEINQHLYFFLNIQHLDAV